MRSLGKQKKAKNKKNEKVQVKKMSEKAMSRVGDR